MAFHVLLVEPDASLADEIRAAFAPLGFSVTTLQAGEAALERCREAPPHLIVLAAELPDMSGFSVCNRLKRTVSSVPLVLYSGEATDSAIEAHRATRTRADEYLKKPFEVADLLARATALVGSEAREPPVSAPPAAADRPLGEIPAADLADVAAGLVDMAADLADVTDVEAPSWIAPPDGPRQRPGVDGSASAPGSALPAVPPPIPPPFPGQRASSPLGRPAPAPQVRDPSRLLEEWPRDPAPPRGTPEEKLEYFRDRLRARDAFFVKVREALTEMSAGFAQLSADRDVLQRERDQERARGLELEAKLAEATQEGAAQAARGEDLRRQLEESENTRQSLSDVLSETMQQHETAEQEWSARIAAADAERARLEEDRARLEAELAQGNEAHALALSTEREERERERAETSARLEQAEDRIAALEARRDELETELASREEAARERIALLEGEAADRAQAAAENAAALTSRLDEATARADGLESEVAEARGRVAALEEESARLEEARSVLEGQLRESSADAQAYAEKAGASEDALRTREAELEAAEQRIRDLTAALEEARASVEATRDELARIEAARAEAEGHGAQLQAERDQLRRELEEARRDLAGIRVEVRAERERSGQLAAAAERLAHLEPLAEEAGRLRKEVATLRDLVQQRTSAAESAARAAQTAAAERARADERLAVEGGRLQAQAGRLEQELAGARRRIDELERDAAARDSALRRAAHDAEERRKAIVAEAAEAGRKSAAEVGRLKSTLVDLERHLETRARSELQLKKRMQELERALQARPPPIPGDPGEIAALKSRVATLSQEIEELRGENEFLNGEVARYVQKNKELSAQGGPHRKR